MVTEDDRLMDSCVVKPSIYDLCQGHVFHVKLIYVIKPVLCYNWWHHSDPNISRNRVVRQNISINDL